MKTAAHLGPLLIIALIAGSSAQSSKPSGGDIQTSNRGPSAAATARLEKRLVREVGHQLRMLPEFSIFDNLAFKVEGPTVTLLGQVDHAILKDEAERSIRRIEGVERIVNRIEILPPSSNDDRIRRATARAIFRDDRLFHYSIQPVPPIHIIVKGGHVTLEGVVSNEGDRNAAGLRANGVPGVFSVENHLQVESSATARK